MALTMGDAGVDDDEMHVFADAFAVDLVAASSCAGASRVVGHAVGAAV